ncbi:hypothetical protein PORUE0001_0557 [Porphyromonas uenonis 60-3]|uniref:Uncharacterized protein n=1 Tax=Porphyromonas uenonis 60-3 TaxID=596327 RepID=C2M9H7_9PORP|nr:hypothetical protein PORUE0001_1955 [Porphyromonas uenonis 60-3]EEK17545.1 hypothetical protein PORUE0001_1814 [Porphyromonas uenonis 60-3]EEK17625.1 hypothetical protein PORUE0001_0557 [Porphyromonas uenonis 60-3]
MRPYMGYTSVRTTRLALTGTNALTVYTEPCLPADRGGTARGSLA